MSVEARKQAAVEFLRAARRGDRAAVEAAVAPGAKHHNAYFAAGMPALIDAMMAAAKGISVVHIFRFAGEKIAELWDVGAAVPAEMLNAEGMF